MFGDKSRKKHDFFHLGDGFKFEDRVAQHHLSPSHFGHYELPEKWTEQSLSDSESPNRCHLYLGTVMIPHILKNQGLMSQKMTLIPWHSHTASPNGCWYLVCISPTVHPALHHIIVIIAITIVTTPVKQCDLQGHCKSPPHSCLFHNQGTSPGQITTVDLVQDICLW